MMSFLTPELIDLLLRTLQALVIMVGSVVVCAALIWVERRLLALWQDRYGPNRVGPFGSLQVVADMLKLIFKEDWTPEFVDKLIFTLAPTIAMAALLIAIAIIPMTPTWGVSDIDIGILLFLGMAGLAVYSVMFAGWASNSKYALLGGVRSTAQTISYEVFMGIAVMGVVAQAGSFNMRDIVLAQQDGWYIIPQFLGFINFALAGVAVAHRAPFDLPEAESELAAGYHTEYSGLKWGMFMVAEYLGVLLVSMLLVTLYFGGWLGPSWLWPGIWFSIKTAVFIAIFILIRAALARPRYDQMMDAGWKVCLPLSLLNLLVTGAAVLIADGG